MTTSPAAAHVKVKVQSIKVGQRHRLDLGDVEGLAKSIADVGLLQPVVLTPDRLLVAGVRRLAAVQSLGWAEVDATVVTGLDEAAALLRAERDENVQRKPFTPTEEHDLYEALLALEKPKAEERKREHGGTAPGRPSENTEGNFPAVKAKAREAAAEAATGKAGRHKTLDKVGEVKAIAADDTKPEPVREIAQAALNEMDATGRVDGAYQRVKDAEDLAGRQPIPAVTDYLEDSHALQDIRYVKSFMTALNKADDFLRFDPERLAPLLDDAESGSVERYAHAVAGFADSIGKHRRGLRLINGGGM